MKPAKKTLRRRAKLCYTGAIVLGITSLLVASGVETAATFGGMIAYSLAAVAVFALALPCVGYARWLEMEADRLWQQEHLRERKARQKQAQLRAKAWSKRCLTTDQSIDEIVQAAAAAGCSYGRQVARLEGRC